MPTGQLPRQARGQGRAGAAVLWGLRGSQASTLLTPHSLLPPSPAPVCQAEGDLSISLQLTCESQASPVLGTSGQNRVFR